MNMARDMDDRLERRRELLIPRGVLLSSSAPQGVFGHLDIPKTDHESTCSTYWRDQKFHPRQIPRFFSDQLFSRPILRLLFQTTCFRDRYQDFFWDQIFSRPIPRLFLDQFLETATETFSTLKFLRPRLFFNTRFFETDTETFLKYNMGFRLWLRIFSQKKEMLLKSLDSLYFKFNGTLHNVYFLKYIFPCNRTSSDLS